MDGSRVLSHSMESDMAGWDWFSLQFDDGSELMLYRLRRKNGNVEPTSSGNVHRCVRKEPVSSARQLPAGSAKRVDEPCYEGSVSD